MARKLFGTDGIRGVANGEPMTAETALRVGMAAGRFFVRGDHRHTALIGKDTRRSGYMIESALTAGLTAMGMDVVLVGPLPTPAVAMLTRSLRADLGIMISASHNPYQDNGVKLFGHDGYKLSDASEARIEALVESGTAAGFAAPADIGQARRLDDAQGRYVEFVKNTFPKGMRLDGLRVVVDCAHGAAYRIAPAALWELGAEVSACGAAPDGFNINAGCGSTDTAAMRRMVRETGADIGISLDGDADRVLIADEKGDLIDGDQMLATVADVWRRAGKLKAGGVVGTVLSGLGLERYLDALGLRLVRAAVGDRYVVQHMREHGYNVGGEQSGHLVFGDYSTTGDGLIAALQMLSVAISSGKPVSEAARRFDPPAQVLRNVRLAAAPSLSDGAVAKAVRAGEARLGGAGRVLVRRSGTEPVVRVMAEGEDSALVAAIVGDIVDAVEHAAGRAAP